MESDHVGPFEPPPSPRPGDLGPPAEGYTRGAALPIPAINTIVAVCDGKWTTFLHVRAIRASDGSAWSVHAALTDDQRARFTIEHDGSGVVEVLGLGDRSILRAAPTHAPRGCYDGLGLNHAGIVFYDDDEIVPAITAPLIAPRVARQRAVAEAIRALLTHDRDDEPSFGDADAVFGALDETMIPVELARASRFVNLLADILHANTEEGE